MKHYVLFYAEGYTGPATSAQEAEGAFENKTGGLALKSEHSKKLGPRSWLIDRENDVALLGALVTAAEGFRLKYSVRFFSSE